MLKMLLTVVIAVVCYQASFAQTFVDVQKNFPRVNNAMRLKQDTIRKQVIAAGFEWPVKQIYIRSFKYDSQLEVWMRNSAQDPFKLFKTYKVCAMAGSLGPKRMEGDYQVPEGFYYINEFNPKSMYHLSLGINYPNASDRLLSDSILPGGEIYIHGSCVTTGCIPVQDSQIEELYILAANAKSSGQDFIPVHIYPVRYNNPLSVGMLNRSLRNNASMEKFSNQLKNVFQYFEQHKKLPLISVNSRGEYVML